jgi:hypothetical protein
MDNQTLASLFPDDSGGMTGETYAGIGAIVAAVAAAIGSIIYASKHIKSSSCMGSKCEQEVVLEAAIPRRARSTSL